MIDDRPTRARSLGELPRDVIPARDLWPEIAAQLSREHGAQSSRAARADARQVLWQRHPRLAAASILVALVATGTLGVLMSRGPERTPMGDATVADAQYLKERPELLRSLNARLASLPPASRQKVLADLNQIESAMHDVQTALGRDPGNALLRTLLLDTYQDEQHLLLTVQAAGAWTRQATAGQGRS